VVTIPLMVLGFLAVFGGYIGMPKLMGMLPNYFEHWLEPVFAQANEFSKAYVHQGAHHSHALEWGLMGLSVVIALVGISIAYTMYIANTDLPKRFTSAFPALHRAVYNKWYIDELYDALFVNPCKWLGSFLWKGFDVLIVDGIVNGVGKLVMACSAGLKGLQSGYIHNYAFGMAAGVVAIVAVYLFR
jgi:NADH-quinone oxidoreductase subunit L